MPTLEAVEISPQEKDKILAKYKKMFEKRQKVYDEINTFNAKQVVHVEPKVCKAVRPTPLPYGPLPKPPEPMPPPDRNVDVGSTTYMAERVYINHCLICS